DRSQDRGPRRDERDDQAVLAEKGQDAGSPTGHADRAHHPLRERSPLTHDVPDRTSGQARTRPPEELGQRDGLFAARGGVAVAELLAELRLELAALLELFDDVGAADELALDEDLRDRRPAGDRREILADLGVGQDVDRGHGRARAPKRFERPAGVAAHDKRRCALHEERDVGAVDDVLDLVGVAHAEPFVLMRSSWMVPSASGVASASYTRRCCSTSESPPRDGAVTTTWK